jgi:hypothetical protein
MSAADEKGPAAPAFITQKESSVNYEQNGVALCEIMVTR